LGEGSRLSSHNAATLPAVRAPARPALTPQAIVARPLPADPASPRSHSDSEAVEIYAAAPPSAEPPPGERAERPGQYSMNRRHQESVPVRDASRAPIPSGLARPRRPTAAPSTSLPPTSTPSSAPKPTQQARASHSEGTARAQSPVASDGIPQTHQRTPHVTAPITSRTGTGGGKPPPSPSNVVMTRPAVIVGAPPKPVGGPPAQKVRKAREEEGRGFGQGLISEKSLDEVILAYLSEDAEEK
jgi:hypothetical protein